jgi:phosphate transport system ATP-binding protein
VSDEPSSVRIPTVVAPPAKLATDGLSYWYGDRPALSDVNLELTAGEVLAVIGPSGSGKSTLLRLFNRLHDTTDGRRGGTVRLDGADIYAPGVDPRTIRRRVGLVLQPAVPFPATVFENVAFGPRAAGRVADLPGLVERSLTRAGLWLEVRDRLHDPAAGLTAGQQQRLCVARALATDPEVLLLDEPAVALDPKATHAVEDLIFELRGELTLVVVTSNPQQAGRVSDRTAFLSAGRLVEVGPADELFTNPRHPQTEAYLTGRFG